MSGDLNLDNEIGKGDNKEKLMESEYTKEQKLKSEKADGNEPENKEEQNSTEETATEEERTRFLQSVREREYQKLVDATKRDNTRKENRLKENKEELVAKKYNCDYSAEGEGRITNTETETESQTLKYQRMSKDETDNTDDIGQELPPPSTTENLAGTATSSITSITQTDSKLDGLIERTNEITVCDGTDSYVKLHPSDSAVALVTRLKQKSKSIAEFLTLHPEVLADDKQYERMIANYSGGPIVIREVEDNFCASLIEDYGDVTGPKYIHDFPQISQDTTPAKETLVETKTKKQKKNIFKRLRNWFRNHCCCTHITES